MYLQLQRCVPRQRTDDTEVGSDSHDAGYAERCAEIGGAEEFDVAGVERHFAEGFKFQGCGYIAFGSEPGARFFEAFEVTECALGGSLVSCR